MANRYIASVRKIKTPVDFGWNEKIDYFYARAIKYNYTLNGCVAKFGELPWTVTRPNGEVKEFSTTGKTYAQVYQEMTNYALGKED